jgi:hypothetical protein
MWTPAAPKENLRLGFLTVDRGSIRGRPAYAVPFHWLADQLCDAVSAEMTAAKLPATAERRDAAVATYSMDQPLAPLMGPEHPAGDEIAEHGCGDERNRDQENGNAVATFQFTNRLQSIRVLAKIGEVPFEAPLIHGRGEQTLASNRQLGGPTGRSAWKAWGRPRWNTLLTGIGATWHRRPPLIGWVTGHGFHSTDETSALQNLNVVTVD